MNKASAWILPITKTISAAVGEFELVYVLPDNPTLFEVPRAPHYCRQAMVWQNRIVPLMDLAARFQVPGREPEKTPGAAARHLIGILVYQTEGAKTPEYGAVSLDSIPWHCEVSDEQACHLPPWLAVWTHYTSACFQPEGPHSAIPILRLDRLFSS
jgi:chemotaxis signal transduction protein